MKKTLLVSFFLLLLHLGQSSIDDLPKQKESPLSLKTLQRLFDDSLEEKLVENKQIRKSSSFELLSRHFSLGNSSKGFSVPLSCKIDINDLNPEHWCKSVRSQTSKRLNTRTLNFTLNYFDYNATVLEDFFRREKDYMAELMKQTINHTKNLIHWQNRCLDPDFYILEPKINKFWLTNPENPKDIPLEFLNNIILECRMLGNHWEMVIWVTKLIFHENAKTSLLKLAQCTIVFKSVYDVPEFEPYYGFIANQSYSNAVTKMKQQLYKFEGGFYEDMDAFLKVNMDYFLQFEAFGIFRTINRAFFDYFFSIPTPIGPIYKKYDKEQGKFIVEDQKAVILASLQTFSIHNKADEGSWIKKENKNDYRSRVGSKN